MDENRFDDAIRSLADDFKVPDPPLEEMWRVIEKAHFDRRTAATSRGWMRTGPWLAAAATLLIGVGIGRYFHSKKAASISSPATASTSNASATAPETSAVADAYRDQTSQYLGQAAALLISLPAKDGSLKADATFANKAADLLVTTRLLIDSPAAKALMGCAANETRATSI